MFVGLEFSKFRYSAIDITSYHTLLDDAFTLLNAGADKVAVNTAAVKDPSIITNISSRFGAQCTVLAIDAVQSDATHWEVVVKSGKEKTVSV